MRIISSALKVAQASENRSSNVSLTVEKWLPSLIANGTDGGSYKPHDFATDGTYIYQAKISAANKLYFRKMTLGGAYTDAWTDLGDTLHASCAPSISVSGSQVDVYAITSAKNVIRRKSTNGGSSFAAAETIDTFSPIVTAILSCASPAIDTVYYTIPTDDNNITVWRGVYSGSWTKTKWAYAEQQLNDRISSVRIGTSDLIVFRAKNFMQDSNDGIFSVFYKTNTGWGDSSAIWRGESILKMRSPSVKKLGNNYWLSTTELSAGFDNTATSVRFCLFKTTDGKVWSDRFPLLQGSGVETTWKYAYAGVMLYNTTILLVGADFVDRYEGTILFDVDNSNVRLTITDAFSLNTSVVRDSAGKINISISNKDGQYNNNSILTQGSVIIFSAGYEGEYFSGYGIYFIEEVRTSATVADNTLTIVGHDALGELEWYRKDKVWEIKSQQTVFTDFEDIESDVTVVSGVAVQANLSTGEKVMRVMGAGTWRKRPSSPYETIALFASPKRMNGMAMIRFRFTNGILHTYAGIGLRLYYEGKNEDLMSGWFVRFQHDSAGGTYANTKKILLIKRSKNRDSIVDHATFSFAQDTWYYLKVTAHNDKLKAWYSTDGISWTAISWTIAASTTFTLTDAKAGYWGVNGYAYDSNVNSSTLLYQQNAANNDVYTRDIGGKSDVAQSFVMPETHFLKRIDCRVKRGNGPFWMPMDILSDFNSTPGEPICDQILGYVNAVWDNKSWRQYGVLPLFGGETYWFHIGPLSRSDPNGNPRSAYVSFSSTSTFSQGVGAWRCEFTDAGNCGAAKGTDGDWTIDNSRDCVFKIYISHVVDFDFAMFAEEQVSNSSEDAIRYALAKNFVFSLITDSWFSDDFTSGFSSGWGTINGTWNVSGGEATGTGSSAWVFKPTNETAFTDGTYTFRAKSADRIGLAFFGSYSGSYSGFLLELNVVNNAVTLWRYVSGTPTALSVQHPIDIAIPNNSYENYTLYVKDGHISLFIDNQLLFYYRSKAYTSGFLAMAAYTTAVFDNIRVPDMPEVLGYFSIQGDSAPREAITSWIGQRRIYLFASSSGRVYGVKAGYFRNRVTPPSELTFNDTLIGASVVSSSRGLYSHVRVIGAESLADYYDDTLIARSARYISTQNPDITGQQEAINAAKLIIRDIEESLTQVNLSGQLNLSLEREDRIRVTIAQLGIDTDFIVNDITVNATIAKNQYTLDMEVGCRAYVP